MLAAPPAGNVFGVDRTLQTVAATGVATFHVAHLDRPLFLAGPHAEPAAKTFRALPLTSHRLPSRRLGPPPSKPAPKCALWGPRLFGASPAKNHPPPGSDAEIRTIRSRDRGRSEERRVGQ